MADTVTYLPRLSPRQRATLELIAQGKTDYEMSLDLGIGMATMRQHVLDLRVKLGARNKAHAVHLAHKRGLLE